MLIKSFKNSVEFDVDGTVLKNAMCCGDVDNDGNNELVVGNSKGLISIFRIDLCKAIFSAKVNAVITAVSVGDILNIGKNVLVVITSCGQLQIYELSKKNICDSFKKLGRLVHSQRIVANIRSIIIGDINGDGSLELVVGLTDRVVRSYQWFKSDKLAVCEYSGKFVSINKWDFAEQVGGIALNKAEGGGPSLLVSQPGGSFHCLKVEPFECKLQSESCEELSLDGVSKITLDSDLESWAKLRTAEICGNVRTEGQVVNGPGIFAAATLDGLLALAQGNKILWKVNLDHQLFALNCLDIRGNGKDSLVACAWDGSTFIASENECVKFSLKQPVSSFVSGMLSYQGKNVPSLVYASFCNRINVYYDIDLPRQGISSTTAALLQNREYISKLEKLGISPMDQEKIQQLNHLLLYGASNCKYVAK